MSNQRVIITGGSSGIGLAAAKLFASKGWDVLICGRDAAKLDKAKSQVEDACLLQTSSHESVPKVFAASCDLAVKKDCVGLVEYATEKLGGVDVLVNNAGIAPLAEHPWAGSEDFDHLIKINLKAPWILAKRLWNQLKQSENGAIVNISSLAAVDPFPGFSLYGGSKAWIETWTKAIAAEGESVGIKVGCVRPGAVETPLLRSLFPDFPAEDCVSPEDIAEKIFWLATDPAAENGSIHTVANQ